MTETRKSPVERKQARRLEAAIKGLQQERVDCLERLFALNGAIAALDDCVSRQVTEQARATVKGLRDRTYRTLIEENHVMEAINADLIKQYAKREEA